MTASPNYHLTLFGTPLLQPRDGSPLAGRAAQRHRLAMLALLALAPGQRLSRDKLIALLWPESEPERGRNLLNVSTYTIRKVLGETALLTAVDDLRLNPDVVSTDALEFMVAAERGDHARAVALYRGPLLDGFFLSDAPEFERWAEQERKRLAGEHDRVLEAIAEGAERERDFSRAVEWWKARAAKDPYDSRVALRLMQALDASGNRAGALHHALTHHRLLEQEWGVASMPAAIGELVDRLRRDRVTASSAQPTGRPEAIEISDGVARHQSVQGSAPLQGSDTPTTRSRLAATRGWLRRLAPLALVAVAGIVWAARPNDPEPARSIVVLPFVNLSPNEDNEYFADGLTEEVITRLAAVPGLKVISRTSAMHYKGSEKPLREIAAELRVAQVLEGSVRRSDGSVRVTAQLIDATTDAHRWAETYESSVQTSFRVQEEIARAVARALEVEVPERARRQLVRRGTSNPDAYELYQRGRVFWQTRTRDGHEQAIRFYQRAIELDSTYADAYAGLSDAYLTAYQLDVLGLSEAESYARVKLAAERAMALDPESAAAHTSFATALWWQRDWPGAMREIRLSLELNPGQAMTRAWLALLLRGMGRSDEAIQETRRAYELDPFAVVISGNVGWHCYSVRDYECAVEQFRRTAAIGAYANAQRGIALAQAQRGRNDEAIAAMREAISMSPQRSEFLADLAYVLAVAGRTEEARESLARAKTDVEEGFNIGRAHVGLNEPDSAFAWFERTSWEWPHRASLDDPALDPVRADPRFPQLAARIQRDMGMR
jgi:TolB-like protein/DNA-binding SARP family transcriptional activator/Flp pilus assembly protein TadD